MLQNFDIFCLFLSPLSFNSTLQRINNISSDLQKLLKYINGTAIVTFFRTPLASPGAGWASVFPSNLALNLKYLKLLLSAITILKLVASSFE